jgi:GMP synthase (glutamine-hydrolysing)
MIDRLRFLLLQVRNPDDPMRQHEIECFARAMQVSPHQITVHDLLSGAPDAGVIAGTDAFLFGGSGHYSAAGEGEWLELAMDALRSIHATGRPTFASCWGCQAMARAMGGRVIHDADRAELGTYQLQLTEAGLSDPLFSPLGPIFSGQMGHEDRVVELPPKTTLLASTELVEVQAYRFDGLPIYCTQFHPELSRHDILDRVSAYPEYVQHISGQTLDEFNASVQETRQAESVLQRFVQLVAGDGEY